MGGFEIFTREGEITQNGTDHVVEVVRDAAGQGAYRLHLLRLAQLRLERVTLFLGALARGDVTQE
jgi:hypothetical protein